MASVPAVGAVVPNFRIPGIRLEGGEARQRDYSPAEAVGAPPVLVFYPGDETYVCTKQLCSYNSELQQFSELGATVWAISTQDLASHERFARKEGLTFPLLADTERQAVAAFGIGMPGLGLRRSVFVIDADGILRWKHVALVGATFQSADTIAKQIRLAAAA